MSEYRIDDVEQLRQLLKEQEQSAKMLVRRDLELTRAYERLRELDNVKSEFISVIAHQLRTPLSVTKWALDILEESIGGGSDEQQQMVLKKGKESNERMIKLVDDLLNVDLHEVGKVQYNFKPTSLVELVQKVLTQIEPLALHKKITVAFDPPHAELPLVPVDAEKLNAVIQNLIENALKYTPEGGMVRVVVEQKEQNILVSVQDSGIGIPKAEREHIFTKFYRGRNAVKTATEGSGLGLYIARKVIQRHGGDIWFESEDGKGTTFSFSIPINVTK